MCTCFPLDSFCEKAKATLSIYVILPCENITWNDNIPQVMKYILLQNIKYLLSQRIRYVLLSLIYIIWNIHIKFNLVWQKPTNIWNRLKIILGNVFMILLNIWLIYTRQDVEWEID